MLSSYYYYYFYYYYYYYIIIIMATTTTIIIINLAQSLEICELSILNPHTASCCQKPQRCRQTFMGTNRLPQQCLAFKEQDPICLKALNNFLLTFEEK